MFRKVKASKRFLTQMFLTILISVSFLLPIQPPASAQQNGCPGNIVKNGDFTTGVIVVGNGNFPPSTVPNWSSAFGTPQVSALPGCGNPGFIRMWGNKTVGEGIKQTLTIQAGHTYRVSLCARWSNNNPLLPNYVRFNFRASVNALPSTSYTATGPQSQVSVIGVTPNITSTTWTNITLADWTAPVSYNTLTINPENDNTANDGNTVSWGDIDNICIREVIPPNFEASTACQGQPTSFNGIFAGAASSWNWNFGDGTPNGTQQNLTHLYANAGTYNVTLCVNGTTNCVTKPVTVKPKPPDPIITGPSDACGLQTATYSVPAAVGVIYAWTASNGTINGSSTGNSVNVTWNGTGVGIIAVTVTNKDGCSSSARMEVSNCDLHLGACCKEFQSKVSLKNFTSMGNGVYSFASTISVSYSPITRVTANIISASVSYAPAGCAKSHPVDAYIVSATPGVPGFTSSLPVQNGDEVIWYGNGVNVSGLSFPFQIKFPPVASASCKEYVSFCVKYTFTDSKCRTCEVIKCFGPFLREEHVKSDVETR